MAFEIVWEARGAYKRFHGYVSDDDLMKAVVTVESDPRFDDLRYVVNDFLAVEGFAVTAENVLVIAAIDGAAARTNPDIRIAIVATDEQVLALAEIYAASPLNAYPTRNFTTIDAARTWAASAEPRSGRAIVPDR